MIIPSHYLSGSNGPTNPAEAAATKVYDDFEKRVDAGMNEYLATGDHKEAACALDQMDAWANAGALMNYDRKESQQAWFQVEWTLSGIGISDSVLVNDATLDPAEQKRVTAWLDAASHKSISFEKPGDTGNNHHDWRALHAIAIGITASDDQLFQFGVTTYRQAIAEINADGAFPKEMARHENATGYQGFALEPLILIAQFAARQGVDLYGYQANGHTIRDAVVFFGKAVENPDLIKPYASEPQTEIKPNNERFADMPFYVSHFGTAGLPDVIVASVKHPIEAPRLGGETTLLAGK
jgi:poly(beta-D-mannuronate) lyase